MLDLLDSEEKLAATFGKNSLFETLLSNSGNLYKKIKVINSLFKLLFSPDWKRIAHFSNSIVHLANYFGNFLSLL